jgi:hypothetical protein
MRRLGVRGFRFTANEVGSKLDERPTIVRGR